MPGGAAMPGELGGATMAAPVQGVGASMGPPAMPGGPATKPGGAVANPVPGVAVSAAAATMAAPVQGGGASMGPPAMPGGAVTKPGGGVANSVPGAAVSAAAATMAAPVQGGGASMGPPAVPGGPATIPGGGVANPVPGVAVSAAAATMAAPVQGVGASVGPPAMPGGAAMPGELGAAYSSQPPDMPPARYLLGLEIARGGMGRVVDATDTVLGRVVAFKEALTDDVDTLRRFEREIRITARLEHPSIVPVHDAGRSPSGAPFYVMRKVSGRPLERLVAGAATLNQRLELIPHIVAAAQAIAHAHERGVVHRDIKPSNILVGELGETVVIDWGLAKVIGEPEDAAGPPGRPLVDLSDPLKTRAGIVYGTPGFMAPEQLRGAPVNEGCDVYALGATLYHLLSREPPHYAKTADEMMKAAVTAPPRPIRDLVDGVPLDLSTIVDQALAHDPKVRYQNARALAEDLQRFLTGQLVASRHYSWLEKLGRLIRRNRGATGAIAALVVVGTLSLVRILDERDRADAAARLAEDQRVEAVRRSEELTLAHARDAVDLDPTRAIAMLKPLVAKHWREVRAIAAAARASGVAWGIAASSHTASLELSRDGRRALSVGSDGAVRIHDLAQRTTRTIAALHALARARWASAERQVAIWHDATLVILELAGPGAGARRELTVAHPIVDLAVADSALYWVDDHHALWQLELSGPGDGVPSAVALDEPVHGLAPSPDGRWIALSGDDHLLLYDRRDGQRAVELTLGDARQIAWTEDGGHFAALIDRWVIDVAMNPEPALVHRVTVGDRRFVVHSGRYMYTAGASDVVVMRRTDGEVEPADRKPLRGEPVGMALARGGTVVAAASAGLTVVSDDGERAVPLQAGHVDGMVASPHSPYVIAAIENRLLVWNLDEIQPRRLADRPPARALFAGSERVIVGGSAARPAQAIELATGAAQPIGDWQGLRSVAASDDGRFAAVVDSDRRVHLVRPGRAAEDLPGEPSEIDLVGLATREQLVLATLDGAVYVHDIATGKRRTLVAGRSPLLGLAWGRGHHPWVAAAFLDGTLWRGNVATGATAQAARSPAFGPGPRAPRDGKLLVAADGTVSFLHASAIHAWRSDGSFGELARLPKPLDDLGEAGPDHIIAFSSDAAVYSITRSTPRSPAQITEALPSVEASSAAMSPDTGLFAVLEHGSLDVVDPLVHQRFPLAPAGTAKFHDPAISPGGNRVLVRTANSLLMWSLELPVSPEATRAWLDAMTNAVDDRGPGGLGWR
jgi:hypothetical protein